MRFISSTELSGSSLITETTAWSRLTPTST
jgi:hypothetical protein